MAAEEPQQQKQEPLGSDSEGVNCLAYDEAIMAQQDRIQQEIAVQNPLVSERLELSVLYKEYAEDDNIYQQKIKRLHPGGVHGPRRGRHHQPAHLPRGLRAQGLPSLPAWTLRHPLQIGLALPAAALLPSPLPGARHVQRFSCGCKWSYFTLPSPVTQPSTFY
uniref:Uncharacterized protein n=1 Tax=Rousettus aegyptiacus TaxID=9407 RepID=A0A7J8H2A9_ROUAE|nr:hypothetical protein HJG63_011387 [Rousettus aegyptiacus]